MTRWLSPLVALCVMGCVVGCAAWQTPAAFPREMEQAFKQGSTSFFRQMIVDNGQFQGSFAGQDPGIESYYETAQVVGTRIRDVDGQFSFGGQGHGIGQMPPDLAQAMIQMGLADEALRHKVVDWLIGLQRPLPEPVPEPEADADEVVEVEVSD